MRRTAVAVAVFAISLLWTFRSGQFDSDFRIDEAHKLSETYYLRLLTEGRIHDPDWFRSLVERTNPPVGKWLFGVSLWVAGLELPPSLAVAEQVNHGERLPPLANERQYRQYLYPARVFDALVTAATAALIFVIASGSDKALAGLIASFLYIASFLPQAFSAVASFDPLLALAVLATCATGLSAEHRRPLARACIAGLIIGIAFNIRATGLMALPALIAGYFAADRLRTPLKTLQRCIAAGATALLACVALNPYYWTTSSDPSVPPEFRAAQWLLPRIFSRVQLQLRDLLFLLRRDLAEQAPLHGMEKTRFVAEYAFGDTVGIILLLGVVAFLIAVALRSAESRSLPVAAWSMTVVVILTAWLPFGYPRYVLVAMPPLALLAGFGWSAILTSAHIHYKRRRNQLTARSLNPV